MEVDAATKFEGVTPNKCYKFETVADGAVSALLLAARGAGSLGCWQQLLVTCLQVTRWCPRQATQWALLPG